MHVSSNHVNWSGASLCTVEFYAGKKTLSLSLFLQEIRNLRALLASEDKLRKLHVTQLRDELEILKSFIFRNPEERAAKS